MAWNKELTKDDLVKAGLNPDDLAELKANGVKKADLDGLKDTLKTELSTSIAEQIKNSFAELETKFKPTPTNNNNNNNGNTNGNNEPADDSAEFLSDPTGYINKKAASSAAYTAIQTTKIRMDLAMDRAKATMKGFKNDALAKEILDEWAMYKPEVMAMNKDFDPDKLITKIHNMVIGTHHEEIQRDTDKREGKFNMVASASGGGGGNGNAGGGTNKKAEDMLTDVEKKQASRYGMTPQEWVDQKKAMEDEESTLLAGK
jgi:hypothetical protein